MIKMLVMPGGQSGAPVQAENSRKYHFMYIYLYLYAFPGFPASSTLVSK